MALLSTIRASVRIFIAELRLLLSFLIERQLLWLGLALTLLLTLALQLPPHYQVEIGQEDGVGADLPLIQGFYPPEHDAHGTFRWTDGDARVNLTGLGSRPLFLSLHCFPVNEEMARTGPQSFELWLGSQQLGSLAMRPNGGSYHVLLPPAAQGEIVLGLRSATLVPSGDQRSIGLVLDNIQIRGDALALPDWPRLLGWLLALLLGWLSIRRLSFSANTARLTLMPLIALLGLAARLDAPRLSLGLVPALITLALCLALALALSAQPAILLILAALSGLIGLLESGDAATLLLPICGLLLLAAVLQRSVIRLWEQLESESMLVDASREAAKGKSIRKGDMNFVSWCLGGGGESTRRWLALLMIFVFALHYGGKIYPFSMPGDIGFHVNRFGEAIAGRIFILSKNRGVDFPYPPALYVMLAPLTILSSRMQLLHLSAALMNAISPALIYLLARQSGLIHSRQVALAAGALYGLSGALFMANWWNFSTHIFAQFAHLLLLTVLVQGSRSQQTQDTRHKTQDRRHKTQDTRQEAQDTTKQSIGLSIYRPIGRMSHVYRRAMLLIVLQLTLYLGHFGFWMNMSLIAAMGLTILLIDLLRHSQSRQTFWFFLLVVAVAQILTVGMFYSAYTGLFLAQLGSTASGGFTGLAGRGAVPKDILWAGLIEGLYAHLGFIPIVLAPLALGLPYPTGKGVARLLWLLMLTSFILGLGFAVLPFLTGSTLSTRWLMFCLWAICLGFVALCERLWQRGMLARLVVVATSAFIVWNSAIIWLSALAWRIRPPEPF